MDTQTTDTSKVFEDVVWSDEKTCASQMDAVKRCGVGIVRAKAELADVDEMGDWLRLCRHFGVKWKQKDCDNAKGQDMEKKEVTADYNQLFVNVSGTLSKESKRSFV